MTFDSDWSLLIIEPGNFLLEGDFVAQGNVMSREDPKRTG